MGTFVAVICYVLDACLDEISYDKAVGPGAVPCQFSLVALSLVLLEKMENMAKNKFSTNKSFGQFKGVLQPLGSDI